MPVLGPESNLSDSERRAVEKLFGDPFAIPMVFKTWLKGYVEENVELLRSQIIGFSSSGSSGGTLPAGIILPWSGTGSPSWGLACNGASYPTATYPDLFAVIGYAAGGSGANFLVPDCRGRNLTMIGTHADVNALFKTEGVAVANRRQSHRHTVTDPQHGHGGSATAVGNHTHSISSFNVFGKEIVEGTAGANVTVAESTPDAIDADPAGGHGHTVSIDPTSTGVSVGAASGAPQDTPAFLVVNAAITI